PMPRLREHFGQRKLEIGPFVGSEFLFDDWQFGRIAVEVRTQTHQERRLAGRLFFVSGMCHLSPLPKNDEPEVPVLKRLRSYRPLVHPFARAIGKGSAGRSKSQRHKDAMWIYLIIGKWSTVIEAKAFI